MSSDPNKKSARTFQCRDVLWDTFEQMARELECSVDYLVNEAMKQYARQRSYGAPGGGRTPFPRGQQSEASLPPMNAGYPPPPAAMQQPQTSGMRGPTMSNAPTSRLPPPPMRPGSGIGASGVGGSNLPIPPPRSATGGGGGGLQAPPSRQMPLPPRSNLPPPATRSAPPPLPRGGSGTPMAPQQQQGGGANGGYLQPSHGASLSVIYQGEKLPVTKDRFVIGRGKQSSDLTLKDPNVSRQHAMIEFQNGVYFMVDMGSTNGVEYNGQRIARKQIAEGDVFKICDHDLRFTYR